MQDFFFQAAVGNIEDAAGMMNASHSEYQHTHTHVSALFLQVCVCVRVY